MPNKTKKRLLPKIVKVVESYGIIGATSKNVIDHLAFKRLSERQLERSVRELLSQHSNKRPCQKLFVRTQRQQGKSAKVVYTASSCYAEAKKPTSPCYLCGAARYKGSFRLLGGSYGACRRDTYLKNILPATICEKCYRTRFFCVSKKKIVFCTGVATLPECFDRIDAATSLEIPQTRLTAQEQMIKENQFVASKVKKSVDDLLKKLSTKSGREVLRWEAVKQRCSLHEARELLVAQVTEQVASVSRNIFRARVSQLSQTPSQAPSQTSSSTTGASRKPRPKSSSSLHSKAHKPPPLTKSRSSRRPTDKASERYLARAQRELLPSRHAKRSPEAPKNPKSSRVLGVLGNPFPKITGWLEKRGKKIFAKKWAKRWIEVDTQFLSVYKSKEDRKPKHVPLRMVTAKHSGSDADSTRPHTFKLEVAGRPNDFTIFSAETATLEQYWIDRISARIKRAKRRKTIA